MSDINPAVSALFNPINLGPLQLKNRIAMAPMTRTFCPGNAPNALMVAYYALRAKNEVGLVITEPACINHKAANGYARVPFMHGQAALSGWQRVVDAVHANGSKIVCPLWHVGALRKSGVEPDPKTPGYSPSGLSSANVFNGVTMSQSDIDDVIQAYAQAAFDAKNIGFDGIEIHAAHGYLIDQFLWQDTNHRTDMYDGSPENRSRFAIETVQAVRTRVGPDFPIVFRFSQWKKQDYSARIWHTPKELNDFLQPLISAGVDIFHCSTRHFWKTEFDGSNLNLAGWTKKLSGKPVISVGSVGVNDESLMSNQDTMTTPQSLVNDSIEELGQRMASNEFDLIAVGRSLLQDPEWVLKIKHSRYNELKPYSKASLLVLE